MKKGFYTKNQDYAFQCDNCYIETHLCPALQDVEYSVQYNRLTDTETIYVQKVDFQKPKFKYCDCKTYYCTHEQSRPITEIRFLSIDGLRGNTCHKQLVCREPNEIQECEMIKRLQEHKVPYDLTFYGESFLCDSCVEVNIHSKRLDQLYVFDGWAVLGACAGCKWHQPWQTHDCMPKQIISCEKCTVSTQEECPAQQMLNDGYTACESKLKCVALRHAQMIREKYKDNQLHL